MSNILIYYSSNKSSNVIETIAKGFVDKGHKVFFLTQEPLGNIHANLSQYGILSDARFYPKKTSVVFYLKHLLALIKFCKYHKIQAVQSHLQQANIVAVFLPFFYKVKVVVCRHHLIEPSKMSSFFDKLINYLAEKIVVPSNIIKEEMIASEKANPKKVELISYVYNFDMYPLPSIENAQKIREEFCARLLVFLCGRFVPLKRNIVAIEAIGELIREGYDIRLMALDEGPELERCKNYVSENKLETRIHFLGYRTNVMEYMQAADVLLHPSYTEASNNTVKEAGILGKTIIACKNVGDFSEYIVSGENGYLVAKENPLQEIIETLKKIYEKAYNEKVGANLKKELYQRFHKSEKIIDQHLKLLLT